MQNEFHPEETSTPQILSTTETEADAQVARLVTERLNVMTERVEHARRRALTRNTVAAIFPLLLLIGAVCLAHMDNYIGVILFLFLPAMFISFSLMIKGWTHGLPEFDAEEIAAFGGLQALAPLFDALDAPLSHKQEQAILAALATLLPQMKASDAHLLTPDARLIINKWLISINDSKVMEIYSDALLIAALKALEQVGDFRAVPHVERLANMNPRPFHNPEILEAAIECLPMLQARCGNVETAQMLLRASDAREVRPDTLLRPANDSGQTASAELLRSSDSPDTSPSEGRQA